MIKALSTIFQVTTLMAGLICVSTICCSPALWAADEVQGSAQSQPLAVMPEAINSFGGAVLDDNLYVYSGHILTTHRYSTETTSKHFRRLNLRERSTWEELPMGPDVQGSALVAFDGNLYQIGGMQARNEPGTPTNLQSIDRFARYSPESATWTELEPMPQTRSTFDAAVLDGILYVVGGWSLEGDSSVSPWCLDALRCDLRDENPTWETIEQPFVRRALAVAAARDKIYVLGGLTEAGGIASVVNIFDPQANSWSTGPGLPGGMANAFSPSAWGIENELYVNGGDGLVYRLSDDGSAWEAIAKVALPRITHRLLPGINNDLLVIGGNFGGHQTPFIESVPRSGNDINEPITLAYSVDFGGDAKQSEATALINGQLIVAGGNRSYGGHDFAEANLVDQVFAFPLGSIEFQEMVNLPEPVQSATAVGVQIGRGRGRVSALEMLSGIRVADAGMESLGRIDRYAMSEKAWQSHGLTIPDNRSMFTALVHDEKIWLFGGSSFSLHGGGGGEDLALDVLVRPVDDPASSFTASGITIPRARRSFEAAILDGKVYLDGGLSEGFMISDEMDILDLETGDWSTELGPETPRLFASMTPLDGKLYVVGGWARQAEGGFGAVKTIEVFDPETKTWTTLEDEVAVDSLYPRAFTYRNRLVQYGLDSKKPGVANFAITAP